MKVDGGADVLLHGIRSQWEVNFITRRLYIGGGGDTAYWTGISFRLIWNVILKMNRHKLKWLHKRRVVWQCPVYTQLITRNECCNREHMVKQRKVKLLRHFRIIRPLLQWHPSAVDGMGNKTNPLKTEQTFRQYFSDPRVDFHLCKFTTVVCARTHKVNGSVRRLSTRQKELDG